jgi:mannose-6-phosphate isomerase
MTDLYPLLFTPVFKDYVWGGRNLKQYGRDLPPGKVAESWEIAAHPDGMTRVANGPLAGRSLQSLLDTFGLDLIGTNNRWALDRGKFPLLVKLLDAHQDLSVQVHPDDAYARANEGNELGKTEMWVVLDAEPGAAVIYGLAENLTPEAFRRVLEGGDVSRVLHRVPVHKGDHICVPAGSLHAILSGVIIAEIQQNSNTTYRVFDWNRTGKDGKSRALHVDQALEVINFHQVRPEIGRLKVIAEGDGIRREQLCRHRVFTTERLFLSPGTAFEGACRGDSLEIWGLLEGEAEVAGLDLAALTFVLLPASLGKFTMRAKSPAVLLRTYVD